MNCHGNHLTASATAFEKKPNYCAKVEVVSQWCVLTNSQFRLLWLSPTVATLLTLLTPIAVPAANNQILGWNNLGMHCMDSDYSVFSILPPYNTINAQLIVNGALVTVSNGYTVTYEAVADLAGSINQTSAGKGNWLQFAPLLYGAVVADQGLPFPGPESFWMPGITNVPQGMLFDTNLNW